MEVVGVKEYFNNYTFNVIEAMKEESWIIKDVKLHKKPIVFIERIELMDVKEEVCEKKP